MSELMTVVSVEFTFLLRLSLACK